MEKRKGIIIVVSRVELEPDLERMAGSLNASQRRRLAKRLRRYADQVEASAILLDLDACLPRTGFPRLPEWILRRN